MEQILTILALLLTLTTTFPQQPDPALVPEAFFDIGKTPMAGFSPAPTAIRTPPPSVLGSRRGTWPMCFSALREMTTSPS